MYVNWRTSIVLWILGFFTFIAGVNMINASVALTTQGIDSAIPLYIIKDIVPAWSPMPVATYFWLSFDSTFILLGALTIVALQRPQMGPEVHRMVSNVQDQMEATRATVEASRVSLLAKMEDERMARQDMFTALNANIENMKKELLAELEKQENTTAKVLQDSGEIAKETAPRERKPSS